MIITDSKKKKAVHHIIYEIMMFKVTANLLVSGVSDQALKNVLIESFGVHSRNLFDFFYKKRSEDDIIASDFINDKKLFRRDKSKKRSLQGLARKDNKQISHLTYSRNNYNSRTKPWNVASIRNNMEKTFDAFFRSLDAEKKSWVNEELRKWNNPTLL
ncbi:MAG: hypothetical protein HY426_02350 [Candidatus Levybacteria bacterium]|nr:hypothetical protein [Candidatus Levybacteria bacterium]